MRIISSILVNVANMAVSSNVSSLASKFRGCLIGSHVGDCIGSPFEGAGYDDSPVSKSVLSAYMKKWVEGPTNKDPIQSYTDDTAMALCVAKSLVENKGFDAKDMAIRFVEEYYGDHKRRGEYGVHVRDVFKTLRDINYMDVFEPAKHQFNGSGSYGNGAAMRIAPVALYGYDKEDEMIRVAKEQSLITHAHQNGYNGAILECLAIHQALKTDPTEKIDPVAFVDRLIEKMTQIEKPLANVGSLEDKLPYCNSLRKIKDIFENSRSVTPENIVKLLGNNISAHKSVPTAIYSFLKSLQPSDDFESPNQFVRAMYHAISVGGDTDTIAAMTGSISGAYHGSEVILVNFQRRCESVEKSQQVADELYKLCCGG